MTEPNMDRPSITTVRRYCDGELPAAEAKQLEDELAADPALDRRVEFERTLHDRLERILHDECPQAPDNLADRVRLRLAEVQPAAAAASPPWRSIASFLRGPQRADIFAVAASLALIGGAVLVGIFGTPIDSWRHKPVNLTGTAAPFVAGEHERCAGSNDVRVDKAPYRRPEEAGLRLSQWLGVRLGAVRLTDHLRQEGWSFVGGGRCGVPVDDHSCHLIYTRYDLDNGPIMLSLFIVPDRGHYLVKDGNVEVAVEPRRWVSLRQFSRPMRVYSDGGLIYMMVACRPEGLEGAAAALESAVAQR